MPRSRKCTLRMYVLPSMQPHSRDFLDTSPPPALLIGGRVSSISPSFMLLRQRTVAFETFARSEPTGSQFLYKYACGSLTYISHQTPMPIGAPSSEFTG